MTKKQQIQTIASEFKWDEKKLLEKLADEKMTDFSPRAEFKERLDASIQQKIAFTKEQKQEKAEMDAVPRKLKWRFYLTGYGYAIVSFVALFLIWFCTNIFTWKLNVPTKYTYLAESKAFWELWTWELAYNYSIDRANNFVYDSDFDAYDDAEIEEKEKYYIKSTVSKKVESQSLWAGISVDQEWLVESDMWWDEMSSDYLLNSNRTFMFDQTYRFAYKSKIFPKLATQYPVYKSNWILMWSNTPDQAVKNLKIWDVSFKKFQDLEIAWLYIQQKTENWYMISFDKDSQSLSFYPNDSRQAQPFNNKLPSQRQIVKSIEKNLKNLGVSIKNYWNIEIDFENYDDGMWIINAFYPLKIQWKDVRNVEMEERLWMQIAYDLNLQKVVSVFGIDIAKYDVSSYPTLEKSDIEKEIEKWWSYFSQWALHENSTVILFDNMEIVYLEKVTSDWNNIYVPAIKWEVSTSLSGYIWPKYVFEEII